MLDDEKDEDRHFIIDCVDRRNCPDQSSGKPSAEKGFGSHGEAFEAFHWRGGHAIEKDPICRG